METKQQLKLIKRNEFGLIENLEYKIADDGSISWKQMIPKEFLYLNPEFKSNIEKKYGKTIPEIDVINDKVDDKDLVCMLGGLKYLLKVRGYSSLSYNIKESREDFSAVSCKIEFIPNFETEGRSISFCENACATVNNTNGFGRKYLLEIATNRAFCRAVRNFLNINIVSKEELGGNSQSEETKSDEADNMLQKIMNQHGVSFEKIKASLIAENYINKSTNIEAKDIKSISEIEMTKQFDLIGRIKRKSEGKEVKQQVLTS